MTDITPILDKLDLINSTIKGGFVLMFVFMAFWAVLIMASNGSNK
jgi:hypothetical protein